ncbi:nucleotidyltransferase domain-containing protein [uncultured Sphingomonas sp.]|uniref:nucleotidyltransferase family protein n=1 Tax=uncultured Sphingomonas sp. TaxID=158754 RepID=UPI00261F70F1|nr:nucleotidyltransferase domain-containing protein [uncultured Sphingomonas sp.]
MTKAEALERLRVHRTDLHAMGIEHVAIFGSTARGEAGAHSDLDLAVRLRSDIRLGWDYFTLDERVAALLGVAVDIVTEPVNRPRLQAQIDRDRVDAF